MRSLRPAALTASLFAALALFVAACGGSNQPGWTYAPAPSTTPIASGAASAPASGEPSGPPSSGETVTVVATTPLHFDTPELTVPAGEPFTLEFDNQDPSVPHNVVIKNPDGSSVPMGDTTFFTGPAVRTYEVGALTAGEYPFLCEVHPTAMTGTLTVQ